MQPAGRVDDDDVDAARRRGVERVVDDGRRVGARGVRDDRHVDAPGPRLRAARWRPRGTCRRRRGAPARHGVLKRCASLAMVVVLPVPLTPTTRMTAGTPGAGLRGQGRVRAARTARAARPGAPARAATSRAGPARLSTTSMRELGAEVGGDERLLDLLPGLVVRRRHGAGRAAAPTEAAPAALDGLSVEARRSARLRSTRCGHRDGVGWPSTPSARGRSARRSETTRLTASSPTVTP